MPPRHPLRCPATLPRDAGRRPLALQPRRASKSQQGGTMSETESIALRDFQAWRDVVTNAVDVLLRQAQRRMSEDSKAVFASRNTGAVLILQAELEKVRDLREQL